MESTTKKMGNGFTYQDYLRWPDEERWEVISGEAFAMTPAPSIRHQEISGRVYALLTQFLKGRQCRPFFAPTDVVLDDHNIVQPDLFVVCDHSKITEKNIQGAPDLIVEIISPSTVLKDKREKLALYERFGVREYLIVHPTDELVERLLLGDDGRYAAPQVFGWEETLPLGIFPELTLNLWEVFGKELPQPVTGDDEATP